MLEYEKGRDIKMKKHNRKLFLIAMLALTAMMLFSAACAEEADGAQKNAEAMAAHAPAVTTLENGVQVQKIPNDPYIWNTAILQSQTRGCTACHALEDAVQKLPLTHPELWNPYNVDMTVNFCYMCHSKALFIQDSMHMLHLSSKEFTDTYNGNCLSCH